LAEPIFSAVASVMTRFGRHGLALLDALDTIKLTDLLATMPGLDLFAEQSLSHYMGMALCNRISKILEPVVSKPVKAKAPGKPPRSVTWIPENERNIALGLGLLRLRSAIKNNLEYGRQVPRQFDVDTKLAVHALQAARLFGSKPETYTQAVVECFGHGVVADASPGRPRGAGATNPRRRAHRGPTDPRRAPDGYAGA
jgi:hypothetical protein